MDDASETLLQRFFPTARERWFSAMMIGDTPASADEGARAILAGVKTATSSGRWDYPDGRIPFAGALCVLLDGRRRPCAIIETTMVEVIPFGSVDAARARAYGEGDLTLAWWRREIGEWYRRSAERHGVILAADTPIIWETISVARRLP